MPLLDGHYRHGGAAISWDDEGVTLVRVDDRTPAVVPWTQIDGARQIGARPGFVQLIVRGHMPPSDPRHDPFSIAVNSDPDANRLVTNIAWRAATERTTETDAGLARNQVTSWRRPRGRRT